VLSSHLIADLELVCDYLVVLVASELQLAGDIYALLGSHYRISGPREHGSLPAGLQVIAVRDADEQRTLLVRSDEPIRDPAWTVRPATMDDLVLGYMTRARDAGQPQGAGVAAAS
jgi:ABC-2 type transport system ATP-binding protein